MTKISTSRLSPRGMWLVSLTVSDCTSARPTLRPRGFREQTLHGMGGGVCIRFASSAVPAKCFFPSNDTSAAGPRKRNMPQGGLGRGTGAGEDFRCRRSEMMRINGPWWAGCQKLPGWWIKSATSPPYMQLRKKSFSPCFAGSLSSKTCFELQVDVPCACLHYEARISCNFSPASRIFSLTSSSLGMVVFYVSREAASTHTRNNDLHCCGQPRGAHFLFDTAKYSMPQPTGPH
jgi:hypothetical protein